MRRRPEELETAESVTISTTAFRYMIIYHIIPVAHNLSALRVKLEVKTTAR